jgi:hypothetical protein
MTPIKRIAFIGNSLPRRCGIATFTTDLHKPVQPPSLLRIGHSPVAKSSPDISKAWATRSPVRASEWRSIAFIMGVLCGFAPGASFGLTLTHGMHRFFAARSGQILQRSRSYEAQNRNGD